MQGLIWRDFASEPCDDVDEFREDQIGACVYFQADPKLGEQMFEGFCSHSSWDNRMHSHPHEVTTD